MGVRAIGFDTFGGPEVLREVDHPAPQVGASEVRIRVAAATVNNGDVILRRGHGMPFAGPAPWIPGMEAAGVVDAVGPGVEERFAVGDAVTGFVLPIDPRGGAYAELAVARADRVVAVPDGATLAQAATLPMNGLTAQALLDALQLTPGSTIAVIGAVGAVGGYVVQLATAAGHTVIADAAPADTELVRSLGAAQVVERGDRVLEGIRQAAGGDVDGLALAVAPQLDAASAVRRRGAVSSAVGFASRSQIATAATRGVRLAPVRVDLLPDTSPALEHQRRLVERGALSLRVADELPAAAAAVAHRRLEAGGLRGRLVLRF